MAYKRPDWAEPLGPPPAWANMPGPPRVTVSDSGENPDCVPRPASGLMCERWGAEIRSAQDYLACQGGPGALRGSLTGSQQEIDHGLPISSVVPDPPQNWLQRVARWCMR